MAREVLKIGLLSDIHIGEDDGLVQGIDVRANFLSALYSKSIADANMVVICGDLANEDAEPGAYRYIADEMEKFGRPYCVIPGNHDRLEVMEKYFNFDGRIHNGLCYFRYDIGGRSMFFLDSSCGEVAKEQLDWLVEETQKVDDEVLLFLHHPPCVCNHLFMDMLYGLRNMEEVQATLSRIGNLKHVFCGHYHCDFDITLEKKIIHVTPSTQMQIDPSQSYFNLKSSTPAWRTITWDSRHLVTDIHI